MSKYTFRQREYHQLTRTYDFEFDVTNQVEWEELLHRADINGIDISELPKDAPNDVQDWVRLIENIPIEELAECEEDLWTLRKGGYDVTVEIVDENGDKI